MKYALATALLALTPAVAAEAQTAAPAATVHEVEVVGAAPLPGLDIPADLIATRVQTLSAADVERAGSPRVLGALETRVGGVSLDDAQDNPFQPNLVYRGFEASPLAGDAQGLAVYLDGGRFNQPFGDTVDWDLVPDAAISQVALQGSNPAFGLNALGGALSVRLKTGFSDPGGRVQASGGSFGRWEVEAEDGRSFGDTSMFAAVRAMHEDGWRDVSPSDVRQAYLDLGWRAGRAETHLKLIGADNDLTGNGPAPVELLAARRASVFTWPDTTRNRYGRASLTSAIEVGDHWSLSLAAYAARLQQSTVNGDSSDIEPCDGDPDLLCLDEDFATDGSGAPIPDFLSGGPYAQLNRTSTRSDAFGVSAQISSNGDLLGGPNHFAAGASWDGGRTHFEASSELGALTATRGFAGPGVIVDQADGSIAPVSVDADSDDFGLYAIDVMSLTPALSLNASARLNLAQVRLSDRLGRALNGSHQFDRLNPAIGATYKLSPAVTVYASYSEANRAPTPAELSCAGPDNPCSLTNFFVGDPDLKQVVARTVEGGARGRFDLDGGVTARWSVSGYRTSTHDDIIFTASAVRGRAYFQNAGSTRRQGVEADLELKSDLVSAYLAYAYTDARFRSPLTLTSPDNPMADTDGLIGVRPGDRMPGIPAQRLKAGVQVQATPALRLGANAVVSSGQVLFGDEANLTPETPAYAIFGLDGAYRINRVLEAFASISNLFGADYETYGTFCPTGDVFLSEAPGSSDPRCLSPGPPRALRAGLRARF